MAVFEVSIEIECTQQAAFEFLIQPENIRRISPPEMGLVFTDAPAKFAPGSQFAFKVQGYGQVQEMLYEVAHFEEPSRFTERQIKGPLRHWLHEHLVESVKHDTVRITDRIEFEPPGGIVGFLITESKLLESLDDGFDYRHRQMQKLLSGA